MVMPLRSRDKIKQVPLPSNPIQSAHQLDSLHFNDLNPCLRGALLLFMGSLWGLLSLATACVTVDVIRPERSANNGQKSQVWYGRRQWVITRSTAPRDGHEGVHFLLKLE
jgi:hypothetical protein